MIFYMRGETKPYILSIDIEYESRQIIQLSGIMLKNIGDCIYQICRNINIYIKPNKPISNFVQRYTDLTNTFLQKYGVDKKEAIVYWNTFLEDINTDDLLIFSHGVYQDLEIMTENGFKVDNFEVWDTLNMSRFVLEKENHLTLQELVTEAGFPPIREHNAYSDAFSNLMLYSYLLKIQGDED